MAGKLSQKQRECLGRWIGSNVAQFTLLYSASKDGCSAVTFHQKCDNKGATVTVAYSTSGYIYGGYTSKSWTSQGNYVQDDKAFLCSLAGQSTPTKYPVTNPGHAIYCHSNYGPTFGDGNDIIFFSGSINKSNNIFTLNTSANFGNSYSTQGHSINNITGGVYKVTELEVYTVRGEESLQTPWRKTSTWDSKLWENLRTDVEMYKPIQQCRLRNVQILLIGPVGSGKSSFFNTINSIFRGRVSSQAPTGSVEHSLTTQFRKYKILVGEGGKPLNFRLCDTMGLEEDQGIDAADIPFILDGNLPDRYQFNPAVHVGPNVPMFKRDPGLKDKIHCVAFVVDSSKVDALSEKTLHKIQSIRHHVNQRGIPLVIILTKIDLTCPRVSDDISKVFYSGDVRDIVSRAADLMGVPRSHVLPVKNYEREIELDPKIDTLALLSMRQMLWYANDFLCNEADVDEGENQGKMNAKD